MNLFELIKLFFNQREYLNISNYDKSKNSFMVNRFCSIHFPLQAAMLSRYKLSQYGIVDYWQSILSKQYKSTPFWMYTKTKKQDKEKNNNKNISEEVKKIYCILNKCKISDLELCLKKFPNETIEELNEIDKYSKL